jgi:hypothetical protein
MKLNRKTARVVQERDPADIIVQPPPFFDGQNESLSKEFALVSEIIPAMTVIVMTRAARMILRKFRRRFNVSWNRHPVIPPCPI